VAPLNRNSGGHAESDQGGVLSDMLLKVFDEGWAGAVIFELFDEWFKTSWNTVEFVQNPNMWSNQLDAAQHFGLVAVEPRNETEIVLDAQQWDWNAVANKTSRNYSGISIQVCWTIRSSNHSQMTQDESFVYIILERPAQEMWGLFANTENLYITFDTITGGATTGISPFPSIQLSSGVEVMLELKNADNSFMLINRSGISQKNDRYFTAHTTYSFGSTKQTFLTWRQTTTLTPRLWNNNDSPPTSRMR
jgi:hypothetical protein